MKKIIILALSVMVLLTACQQQAEAPKPTQPKPEAPADKQDVKKEMQIALVALEDDGKTGEKIGCGDSLVVVKQPVDKGEQPLNAALDYLLNSKEEFYGQSGLTNVLYDANLKIDSIKEEGQDIVVKLSGSLTLGGVCDNPRVEEQLTQTIEKNSGLNAKIFINDKTLEEYLSLK